MPMKRRTQPFRLRHLLVGCPLGLGLGWLANNIEWLPWAFGAGLLLLGAVWLAARALAAIGAIWRG